jgi:hypothetical protein
MMAEFIEQQEEGNLNDFDQQLDTGTTDPALEADNSQEQEDDLPAKYKGKTPAELARMHQEAEKLIGRQAQEVGESRRLLDEVIKQQLSAKQDTQPQAKTQEIDWYEDPAKATNQQIENNPVIQGLKQQQAEMAKTAAQQRLQQAHPDYSEIASSDDFAEWVKASRIRTELFAKAYNFDYDSADELLSTYKALKNIKTQQVQGADDSLKKAETEKRTQSLKAAAVPRGGSGESSKPIYKRVDLITLKMRDPMRYEMMSEEIMQAYAEGRVK